jgi:hypothetical protein
MSIPKSSSTSASKAPSHNPLRRYLIMEDQFKQMAMEYNEKKEKIK